jgi:beta-phosphoglucomutase family hydrolase
MPENKLKAVIWDMDGVIADTSLYHRQAWQQVLRKRGINYTDEDFLMGFGRRNEDIIESVMGKEISQDEINAITTEKEESFRSLAKPDIRSLPGVIELIKAMAEDDYKLALASSTPIENISLLTESLGINRYFQNIVSAEDVTEGKPDPQVFLLAAEGLGIKPENCVVIEDAVAGITAARRAGMKCLAVTNTNPGIKLMEADLIVDTLEDVTVDDIDNLLNLT